MAHLRWFMTIYTPRPSFIIIPDGIDLFLLRSKSYFKPKFHHVKDRRASSLLPKGFHSRYDRHPSLLLQTRASQLTRRLAALERHGGDPSGWTVPGWTVEDDRAINRDLGTRTTILSMTAPGAMIESDPVAQASLARQSNEAAAKLRDDSPSEYGFFASLPSLLNTKACMEEIAYSLDKLHADGVIVFTRYGDDNHYLGHEDFLPIWAELDRRAAVVFVHPTHGVDTALVNPHLPLPMFDYPHETGRTGMDLILADSLNKFPNCKVILSHAGGTLPYLIYRAAGMLPYTPFGKSLAKSTEQILADARKFYYDTALSANPLSLPLLLKLAPPGHVLFGSDFPNAPSDGIKYYTKNLDESDMSLERRQDIEYGAALNLFPRLRRT